jgi:hypothetical protein
MRRGRHLGRGQTIWDKYYGIPPDCDKMMAAWHEGLTDRMLALVWDAYDQLHSEFFPKVDWSEDYDDLERSICLELERAIQTRMNGFMPVCVQHGPYEHESRSRQKSNAQPPQYDIAFVSRSDPRVMWPLEAKVLKSDDDSAVNLGDYAETIIKRFLTCYYAPFSDAGAMLGYLKSGDTETIVKHIADRLGLPLTPLPEFPGRCHCVSDHSRTVPVGKGYPERFRCHHLIMPLA